MKAWKNTAVRLTVEVLQKEVVPSFKTSIGFPLKGYSLV